MGDGEATARRTARRVRRSSQIVAARLRQVPAICIAIVQNYTLRAPAGRRSSWRLERRKVRLDDAVGDEAVPEDFEHLLLLKRACEVRL